MNKIIERLDNGRVLVKLNRNIYEKEAVLATSYKFSEKGVFHIGETSEDEFEICFLAIRGMPVEQVVKEYCSELIDQQLRIELERRFGKIREVIVRQAFAPVDNLQEEVNS